MQTLVLILILYFSLIALILLFRNRNSRNVIYLISKVLLQNFLKKSDIEKFFNEYSPAAKKLYAHCVESKVKVGFAKSVRVGISILGVIPVIVANEKFFKEKSETNGLLELILVHELAHILVDKKTRWTNFSCARGKKIIFCNIASEIAAWEKAFLILKELDIKIDADVFWREAALRLGTHLRYFAFVCDKIKTPRCPRILDFLSSEVITKFRNFSQKEYDEIEKMFFYPQNQLDIPEKNFIIE